MNEPRLKIRKLEPGEILESVDALSRFPRITSADLIGRKQLKHLRGIDMSDLSKVTARNTSSKECN